MVAIVANSIWVAAIAANCLVVLFVNCVLAFAHLHHDRVQVPAPAESRDSKAAPVSPPEPVSSAVEKAASASVSAAVDLAKALAECSVAPASAVVQDACSACPLMVLSPASPARVASRVSTDAFPVLLAALRDLPG